VTLGAVVNLAYLAILAVYFFIMPTNLEGFTFTTGMLILATWALGILWYLFWTWRSSGRPASAPVCSPANCRPSRSDGPGAALG